MGHEDRSLDSLGDVQGLESLFDGLLRRSTQEHGGQAPGLRDWVDLAEAWRIAHALRDARGNRSAAARALGIGRRTLYSKMEKLGIAPSWTVRTESESTHKVNGAVRLSESALANTK